MKNQFKQFIIIFLGIIFIFSFVSYIYAYRTFGGRHWINTPVVIHVDTSGSPTINDKDRGVTAVINAFKSSVGWNGAVSNILDAIPDTVYPNSSDGIVSLYFHDPNQTCVGSCVAATSVMFSGYTIVDADIVVNESIDFTTEFETDGCYLYELYLESTMVHEAGHVLGLAHSRKPWATMYPMINFCDNKLATISLDDARGLQSIYY